MQGNLTVVLLLLLIAAAVGFLAKRLRIHYNIALVLAGVALAATQAVPKVSLRPEVVLQVFLPIPLLRAAPPAGRPPRLRCAPAAGPPPAVRRARGAGRAPPRGRPRRDPPLRRRPRRAGALPPRVGAARPRHDRRHRQFPQGPGPAAPG